MNPINDSCVSNNDNYPIVELDQLKTNDVTNMGLIDKSASNEENQGCYKLYQQPELCIANSQSSDLDLKVSKIIENNDLKNENSKLISKSFEEQNENFTPFFDVVETKTIKSEEILLNSIEREIPDFNEITPDEINDSTQRSTNISPFELVTFDNDEMKSEKSLKEEIKSPSKDVISLNEVNTNYSKDVAELENLVLDNCQENDTNNEKVLDNCLHQTLTNIPEISMETPKIENKDINLSPKILDINEPIENCDEIFDDKVEKFENISQKDVQIIDHNKSLSTTNTIEKTIENETIRIDNHLNPSNRPTDIDNNQDNVLFHEHEENEDLPMPKEDNKDNIVVPVESNENENKVVVEEHNHDDRKHIEIKYDNRNENSNDEIGPNGDRLAGSTNQYNYFHSILQVLYLCNDLTVNLINYYYEWQDKRSDSQDMSFICDLGELFTHMHDKNEKLIYQSIRNLASYFQNSLDNNDILKFYLQLLSKINFITKTTQNLSSIHSTNSNDAERKYLYYKCQNDGFVFDLFCGQLSLISSCEKCGKCYCRNHELFRSITLQVPESNSKIEECLKRFFQKSIIKSKNYTCCYNPHIIHFSQITHAPRHLFIYFKRGTTFCSFENKQNALIYFDQQIHIPTTTGTLAYDVKSVIDYVEIEDSHRYIVKFVSDTQWFLKEELREKVISWDEVSSNNTIGLLLERSTTIELDKTCNENVLANKSMAEQVGESKPFENSNSENQILKEFISPSSLETIPNHSNNVKIDESIKIHEVNVNNDQEFTTVSNPKTDLTPFEDHQILSPEMLEDIYKDVPDEKIDETLNCEILLKSIELIRPSTSSSSFPPIIGLLYLCSDFRKFIEDYHHNDRIAYLDLDSRKDINIEDFVFVNDFCKLMFYLNANDPDKIINSSRSINLYFLDASNKFDLFHCYNSILKKLNLVTRVVSPLKLNDQPTEYDIFRSQNVGFICDCFYGEITVNIFCSNCKNKTVEYQHMNSISISVPTDDVYIGLEDCIGKYFAERNLETNNNRKCCDNPCLRINRCMTQAPKYLFICLDRFSKNGCLNNVYVGVGEGAIIDTENEKVLYSLCGVIDQENPFSDMSHTLKYLAGFWWWEIKSNKALKIKKDEVNNVFNVGFLLKRI